VTTNEATLILTKGAIRVNKGTHRGLQAAERGSTALQMTLQGADKGASISGLEELPGKTNYFIGNDPKKWRIKVPTYAKVKYKGVYPGIDLVYYGNQSGQLEYDYVIGPDADPNTIGFSIGGTNTGSAVSAGTAISVDANGDLLLHDANGDIRFQKPIVYQEGTDGKREYREGRYIMASEHTGPQQPIISFALGTYDHSRPLVIDPAIVYSTILAGTIGDAASSEGRGIATFTDPSTGHTYGYVAGETCTSDFPTVHAEQTAFGGGCGDAFITKFDPAASGSVSVVYSTYLGGSAAYIANAIAVDTSGNVFVNGVTSSVDFPTTQSAYSRVSFGNGSFFLPTDVFLTKLSADGTTLMYSTYFGGSQPE